MRVISFTYGPQCTQHNTEMFFLQTSFWGISKYQEQIQKLLFHLNSNPDFKGNCDLNRETVLDFRKECLKTWLSGQNICQRKVESKSVLSQGSGAI